MPSTWFPLPPLVARALSPRGFPEAFIGASTFNLGSGGHPDDDMLLTAPGIAGSVWSRVLWVTDCRTVCFHACGGGAWRPTIIHPIPMGLRQVHDREATAA